MSKELLPCPFCNSNLEPVTINGQVNHYRHVLSKCMLSLEPVFCNEYRAWNTRIAQISTDVERLMVLAIKHCPSGHHDWPEIKELTKTLQQGIK